MTTQDSIETLEEIVMRHFLSGQEDDVKDMLTDPAILAHIPAYAGLKAENERYKQGFVQTCQAETLLIEERDSLRYQLTTLESQLNDERLHVKQLETGFDKLQAQLADAIKQRDYWQGADQRKLDQLAALQAKAAEDEWEIQQLKEIRASLAERNAQLFERVAALQAGPNASVLSEYINRMRVDFNSNGGFRIGDILAQAEAYLNDKQPTAPAVVAEGYALVPIEPNKAALIGEFQFSVERTCSACSFHGVDEDCEVCGGEVEHREMVTVPWTTIKEIIAAHIASAPAIQPQAAAPAVVPEVWKLVPVEPTREMQDAWDSAGFDEDLDKEFAKSYRAMLSAAPNTQEKGE